MGVVSSSFVCLEDTHDGRSPLRDQNIRQLGKFNAFNSMNMNRTGQASAECFKSVQQLSVLFML